MIEKNHISILGGKSIDVIRCDNGNSGRLDFVFIWRRSITDTRNYPVIRKTNRYFRILYYICYDWFNRRSLEKAMIKG